MSAIEQLPATQQAALRAAAREPLRFAGGHDGYLDRDGARHPQRTVRALARAHLVALVDRGAAVTILGQAVVDGTLDALRDQEATAAEGGQP